MKNNLNKTILIFCLFLSFSVKAQNDNDSINKPKRRIIITGASGIKEKNTRLDNPYYLVKLSPLSFFRGEIPLHIEVKISKKISIEFTPFFTKKDFITPTLDEEFFVRPFEKKGEHEQMDFDYLKFKKGTGYRAEIRMYVDRMFKGKYIGFAASKKEHFINADIPNLMQQGYAYRNMDFSYKSTDLRLTFGFSKAALSTQNVYYDLALGIGTRSFSAENYPNIYIVQGNNRDKTYNLNYGDFKTTRFAVFGNIKIGFTF